MNINSERFERAEAYSKLREWAERLNKFEGVPDMYRDIPSYPESLTREFEKIDTPRASEEARSAFLDKHLDYLDTVRRQVQLKDSGYLKTQQLIAENYGEYPGGAFAVGLDPAKEMNLFAKKIEGDATPFSKGFMSPAHELYGHLRPSLFGLQPADAPVTVPGLPGVYKPSIISPTNESLAHSLNSTLIRNLGLSPETVISDPTLKRLRSSFAGENFPHFTTLDVGRRNRSLSDFSGVEDLGAAARALEQTPEQSPYLGSRRQLAELFSRPPSDELMEAHPRLPEIISAVRSSNYLSQDDFLSGLDIPRPARKSIATNLLNKYVDPSLRNFKEGLRISTPGFAKYTDSPSAVPRGINPLEEESHLVSDKLKRLAELDPSKNYSPFGMMLFNADPVTSAALGARELGRAVKRTPTSLLPGVADLIPSPEAIRTGYSKGPTEMGRQMAQEFIQSLPTAAGATAALSTPLAAPFAPGVGAGLVGVAGARALNEVVRQETGEGIVPKLRQFIGTAPRTGVAAPAPAATKSLVASVKPLTAEQKKEMQRRAARSELEKRVDLLKERFNPAKGEFGLSELLFGR